MGGPESLKEVACSDAGGVECREVIEAEDHRDQASVRGNVKRTQEIEDHDEASTD
jgi:hypothetical protein